MQQGKEGEGLSEGTRMKDSCSKTMGQGGLKGEGRGG